MNDKQKEERRAKLKGATTVSEASLYASQLAKDMHPVEPKVGFDYDSPSPDLCRQRIAYHRDMVEWYEGQLAGTTEIAPNAVAELAH